VIVREVLADLHKVIIQTGALPILYNAYPAELKSLFQNLLSNSIKFRKPGIRPVLHIDAKQTNGYWQCTV
jgi:signal transduction histidine kinase